MVVEALILAGRILGHLRAAYRNSRQLYALLSTAVDIAAVVTDDAEL